MKSDLKKRLQNLESALGQFCPHCTAFAALSEEELDVRIQALASGQVNPDLPEPNRTCHRCRRLAAMSEAEIDAKLAWLNEILARSEKYLDELDTGVAARGREQ